MSSSFVRVVLLICLLTATHGVGSGAQINLLSAQYDTTLGRGAYIPDPASRYGYSFQWEMRTNTSFSPVMDSLPGVDPYNPYEAIASADSFSLFTRASADRGIMGGSSSAFARTEFAFTTETAVSTPIRIYLSTGGQFAYGSGQLSLTDVETDTVLWSYSYNGTSGTLNFNGANSTIDWAVSATNVGVREVSLLLNTELESSHAYRFGMLSESSSHFPDSDYRLTEVYGLEVPEPSTFVLTALTTVALLITRRRRK